MDVAIRSVGEEMVVILNGKPRNEWKRDSARVVVPKLHFYPEMDIKDEPMASPARNVRSLLTRIVSSPALPLSPA